MCKEMSSTVACSMWFVDLILVAPSDIRCLIFEEVVNINIKVLVSQLVKKYHISSLTCTCRPVMARITYTNDLDMSHILIQELT